MIDHYQRRVDGLAHVFTEIGRTRMLGVPLQNPALLVQALGFAPDPDDPEILSGVLVTPWFMNLVRLPTRANPPGLRLLAVGEKGQRAVGKTSFDFLGASEADIGAFEVCSLFSPMFEFADHAAAADTATEILNLLRLPMTTPAFKPPAEPTRRGFLFGRGIDAARARA